MNRRGGTAIPIAARWQPMLAAMLAAAALLFGGGGAEGPFNNGVIQAASALLFAALLASQARGSWPLPPIAARVGWFVLGLVALLVGQLIPLPPSLWTALPGREVAAEALALIGRQGEWRPISLDPEATLGGIASLCLPLALLFAMLGATRREIRLILIAVAGAALVSAVAGALQVSVGYPAWLTFYDGPNPGAASGVFANPNHHAAMLVVAMLACSLLIRLDDQSGGRRPGGRLHVSPWWLAVAFLAVTVVMTGSRAGMAMLVPAIPIAAAVALGWRSGRLWLTAGVLTALALVIVLVNPAGNVSAAGQTMAFSQDGRAAFLPDILYTLGQTWPWGSGLGTFATIFALNENLDVAAAGFVNQAHNDLLEWLIETGAAGAVWLLAAILALGVRAILMVRGEGIGGRHKAAILAGGAMLILLGAHSLIDYPLRIEAVSALAAIAIGLVLTPFRDAPSAPATARHGRWLIAAGLVVGLALAFPVLRLFMAQSLLRADQGQLAASLRPQSGSALAAAAQQRLQAGQSERARQLAEEAIHRSPLSQSAVRLLAMTAPPQDAGRAWQVASLMGWRDGQTQLWAFQQAFSNREWDVAAIRADAFLRTRQQIPPEAMTAVRAAATEPRFRQALLGRLTLSPGWRATLFAGPVGTSSQEVNGLVALLEGLAASPLGARRADARATVMTLLARGEAERAARLHRLILPKAGNGPLLDDGGFDRDPADYQADSTPFDWTFVRAAGGSAAVEDRDGMMLYVESDGSNARPLVQRHVALDAGSYRLSYDRQGDPESPDSLGVGVRCLSGTILASSPRDPLGEGASVRRSFTFIVPPGCPVVRIDIEAKAAGQPVIGLFDSFAIDRLGDGSKRQSP